MRAAALFLLALVLIYGGRRVWSSDYMRTARLERRARSGSMELRVEAIRKLGDLGKEPVLLRIYNEENRLVKMVAAVQLAKLGNPIGHDFAASALDGSMVFTTSTRQEAAYVIAYAGSDADLALLEEVIKSSDSFVRRDAVFAREHLKFKAVPEQLRLAALKKSLFDPNPSIRRWAEIELTHMKSGAALAILVAAEKNPEHPDRIEVGWARFNAWSELKKNERR